MQSVIEKLYYGTVVSGGGICHKGSDYQRAMELKRRNAEKLLATLNESEKELFEKFNEAIDEADELARYDAFSYALKLGTRLAFEVFAEAENFDLQEI